MPSSRSIDHSSVKTAPQQQSADSPLKSHIARSTIIKTVVIAVVVAALLGYLGWDIITNGPLMRLFSPENQENLQNAIASWGFFAPTLYILLQIVQTVVAPIPGQVVGGIGGYLFGIWGVLWTLIGTLIGCYVVFRLARRFGRPLLEKLFKKSALANFDFIINAKSASLIVFAIFLLPGFPDDIVCYIAGLTKLPMRRLLVLVALGRLPTIVLTNLIGAGVSDNLAMAGLASLAGVVVLAVVTWKREWFMKLFKGQLGKSRTKKSAKTQTSQAKTAAKSDHTKSDHPKAD